MSDSPLVLMLLDNPFVSDARVERAAGTLTTAGFRVIIWAEMQEGLARTEIKNGYTINRILGSWIHRPFSKSYKIQFRQLAKEVLLIKPDVIHLHDFRTLPLLDFLDRTQRKTSIIYDAHEYLSGWYFYRDIPGRFNRLKGYLVWKKFCLLEKKLAKHADAVITVGEGIAAAITKKLSLSSPAMVVRNFPKKFTFKKLSQGSLHQLAGVEENRFLVVHSGNIYYQEERLRQLINTFSKFRDASLIFIGSSERWLKLKEELEHKPQFGFISYPLDRSELFSLLSGADAGLVYTWDKSCPSHWLSLPNRITEYTTVGLPVISTSQPEFVNLSKTAKNIVLCGEGNGSQIESAISHVRENQASLVNHAKEAAEIISWESESSKLADLYQMLLKQ